MSGEHVNIEDRILRRLAQHAAQPKHLYGRFGASDQEVDAVLDDLEQKGWLTRGLAWYGNDPTSGITVCILTPAGRQEAAGRERVTDPSSEPILVAREELVTEIKRRFGWSDEQIALNQELRHEVFWYWPSIGAYRPAIEQ